MFINFVYLFKKPTLGFIVLFYCFFIFVLFISSLVFIIYFFSADYVLILLLLIPLSSRLGCLFEIFPVS